MEMDGRQHLVIDDAIYCLPQDHHQANPSEVGASPLGDHHYRLPGTRRREFSSPSGCLYYYEDLLPVSCGGIFLLYRQEKPHFEVFGPHAGQASGAM